MDAGTSQKAPRMRKQNASYDPGYGVLYQVAPELAAARERAEQDGDADPVNAGSQMTYGPTRGRMLSPIEEVQFFPEKHGDAASISSGKVLVFFWFELDVL